MRENRYQVSLIAELRRRFPGCVILKNDPAHLQGMLDLLVLYKNMWAMLEVKASAKEPFQPNQEYYLELLDSMSFAACVFPENEEEVLDALERQFKVRRQTRVSKR